MRPAEAVKASSDEDAHVDQRPAAIRVLDLTVVRGGRPVVQNVSLDLTSGRVTGLLGPSGSGKTTLMRAIVGVQIVTAGEVEVLGLPAGSPPLRLRVGYVTHAQESPSPQGRPLSRRATFLPLCRAYRVFCMTKNNFCSVLPEKRPGKRCAYEGLPNRVSGGKRSYRTAVGSAPA